MPSQILVSGDAAATAANLREREALFRAGLVCEALLMLLELAMTCVLYLLCEPVSRLGALLTSSARLG